VEQSKIRRWFAILWWGVY